MATFEYNDLKQIYNGFEHPFVSILVNGENGDIGANKDGLSIVNVEVENTSGFEASIATYDVAGVFDVIKSEFRFEKAKKFVTLGSSVVINLGYERTVREVFRGFISSVNFIYPEEEMPVIRVTAMDIKGIMMSGSYSRQLRATSYSDAVKEILERTNYEKLKSDSIYTKLEITDTPDKTSESGSGSGGASGGTGGSNDSDITIEMVAESDYEFVVKAAKKFNYEFFSLGGIVYFRKAKSDTDTLMVLGPSTAIRDLDVEYDITGLVSSIEVRGHDAGKAQLINAKKKINNKISFGNKAKSLVSGIEKVYIDPTIRSKDDATNRADFLAEDISYRLGTARITLVGIPELSPGKFIELKGLGFKDDPRFYVVSVVHRMDGQLGYSTRVIAKAASVDGASSGSPV